TTPQKSPNSSPDITGNPLAQTPGPGPSDYGDSALNSLGPAHTSAGSRLVPRIRSAAFSPTIIAGALVLPPGTVGMIEASATRRLSMPCTRSWGSTTDIASWPIL